MTPEERRKRRNELRRLSYRRKKGKLRQLGEVSMIQVNEGGDNVCESSNAIEKDRNEIREKNKVHDNRERRRIGGSISGDIHVLKFSSEDERDEAQITEKEFRGDEQERKKEGQIGKKRISLSFMTVQERRDHVNDFRRRNREREKNKMIQTKEVLSGDKVKDHRNDLRRRNYHQKKKQKRVRWEEFK